jgi:hypothetical protein
MMLRLLWATLSLTSAFVSIPALATPAIFNECAKDVKIVPVPGGNGVFLDKDCKTGYVLPPSVGSIALSQIAPTSNLEMCPILQNSIAVLNAQSERLAALAERLKKKSVPPPSNNDSGGLGGGSVLFPAPPEAPNNPGSDTHDGDQINQELSRLLKSFGETMAAVKEYWQLQGATASFTFINDQQKLVAAYQARNPKIHMEAMPVYDTRFNLIRQVGAQAQLPAVIGLGVAGENIPSSSAQGGPNEGVSVPFGSALSGQLSLSLTGACPFYDFNKKAMPEKIAGAKLSAYLAGGVSYTYYLASERSYWAKYNLGAFARRVQSSESHGGFFSSSTANKLIVEKDSHDWFQFKSLSDDPRHLFEENLRTTVKAELIDRVWKQIALVTVGGPEQAPAISTPKANGAEVGASQLQKCPYIYCQIGAAVLTVADAIFGSSNAVAEFISTNDHWSEETVTETSMFPFTQTVAFEAR